MTRKIYILYFTSLFLLFFANNKLLAQDPGINLNTEEALKGFVLIEKQGFGTFLINNCGEVINHWPSVDFTDFHPKLLPNGNILFQRNSTVTELDWDGNLVSNISLPFGDLELVYEVIKLPNGNYLSLARRSVSSIDFIDLGYDLSTGNPNQVDVVVELNATNGDIVWMWDISDHIIQERDQSLNNFGVVADHPELINMDALSTYDWTWSESFMINGMDYNPQLDQIALSVRKMSEIMIIDHSTTTAEAAGHTGGNSGKGGDILYRWGNPQNYGQGDANDRFLFLQHNPKWITSGPNEGKMTCYNNGLSRPSGFYSEVPLLTLPVDADGNYSLTTGAAFEPEEPDFIYGPGSVTAQFYSEYTSGAQLLENGNMFITEGVIGRLLEYNPAGELVWQYRIPDAYYIFRTEKYPSTYPAFDNVDLTANGDVPNAVSTYNCDLFTTSSLNDFEDKSIDYKVQYLSNRTINVINTKGNGFTYTLFDTNGIKQLYGESNSDEVQLSLDHLSPGFYILGTAEDVNENWQSNKILIR